MFPVGALTVGAILIGALRLGFGLIKHLRGRSVGDGRAQHILGPRRPGPIVLGMLAEGRPTARRPALLPILTAVMPIALGMPPLRPGFLGAAAMGISRLGVRALRTSARRLKPGRPGFIGTPPLGM